MTNLIECSAAAYSCPLLIKNLLNSALIRAPEQEIVYRSQARFSYRDFHDRVGRLASGSPSSEFNPGTPWGSWIWTATDTLNASLPFP